MMKHLEGQPTAITIFPSTHQKAIFTVGGDVLAQPDVDARAQHVTHGAIRDFGTQSATGPRRTEIDPLTHAPRGKQAILPFSIG